MIYRSVGNKKGHMFHGPTDGGGGGGKFFFLDFGGVLDFISISIVKQYTLRPPPRARGGG